MKPKKETDPKKLTRRRRIAALSSLAVVLLLAGGLTWFLTRFFVGEDKTPEAFKEFVESYGFWGRFVAIGIQILQVVVSLIPGELVEVGMGYAYGAVEGTLLCMLGVAVASSLIFLLVKKWGIKFVEVFFDHNKIDQLRFINSEKKLDRLIFILYFIPGTPKDLFTYFVGLTRIRLSSFLVISLIARIPSVVSSTIGGNMIQSGEYGKAVVLFVVTGGVSLLGILLYNKFVNRKNGVSPTD